MNKLCLRWFFKLSLFASLLFSSPLHSNEVVDVSNFQEFFLWAGVKPQRFLNKAETVYILSGEVREENKSKIVPLKASVPSINHAKVWLTVRVERIDLEEQFLNYLLSELALWDKKNSELVGLQIDFDANTYGLDKYFSFLTSLRKAVPEKFKLSITGVMDWIVLGDREGFRKLNDVVDEIIIQTYQGTKTIQNYRDYLSKLDYFPLPYKIGLVQNGLFDANVIDRKDPNFMGYVVFLVN